MCSIGLGDKLVCSEDGLFEKKHFTEDEWELLKVRSNACILTNVCENHKKKFLQFFSDKHPYCCDPYNNHKKSVKGVVTISMLMHRQSASDLTQFSEPLIPGKKLCKRCFELVSPKLENVAVEPASSMSQGSSSASSAAQSQETVAVDHVREMITKHGSVQNVILGPSSSVGSELIDSASQHDEAEPQQHIPDSPEESPQDVSVDLFSDDEKPNTQPPSSQQSSSQPSISEPSQPQRQETDDSYVPDSPERKAEAIDELNTVLATVDNSPIIKRKLPQVSYGFEKLQKVEKKVKEMFVSAGAPDIPNTFEKTAFTKIISTLKDKFRTSKTLKEKIGVLSIALISLSQRDVLSEFEEVGATLYMIKHTSKLVGEQEILPNPAPKKGRPLSQETVDIVLSFYEDDQYSKSMPGKKDCVSVREGDKKILKQKRVIMGTLRELYIEFQNKYRDHDVKVGFTKFATLRPKHCVFATAAGAHNVCVCKYHQNFKLLIEAGNFKQYGLKCSTHHDFISSVICEEPTPSCYLDRDLDSRCQKCPGTENLAQRLTSILEENMIEEIKCKQWTDNERCQLETLLKSSEDFVELFIEQLIALLPHHFVTKQQAKFYATTKENLQDGEALVICDFAENYTCDIQDCVQDYYWDQPQVTIHPFSTYFKENGKVENLSFAVISDHLKHGVSAVYVFQKYNLTFLKSKIPNLSKVIYFSDGASQQYKNKYNLLNLNLHKEDFGVPAEWHFFATSHGKGPCDGMAGTLKRNAYLATIRNKTPIRNPLEFFEWADKKMENIHVKYVTSEEVKTVSEDLQKRFTLAMSLPNIRKLHSIVWHSRAEFLTKTFSLAETGTVYPVEEQRNIPTGLEGGDFVAINLDKGWTVAEIQFADDSEIFVSCFVKSVGNTFKRTESEEETPVPMDEILAKVTPYKDGSIYKLNPHDLIQVKWQRYVIKMELKRRENQEETSKQANSKQKEKTSKQAKGKNKQANSKQKAGK